MEPKSLVDEFGFDMVDVDGDLLNDYILDIDEREGADCGEDD